MTLIEIAVKYNFWEVAAKDLADAIDSLEKSNSFEEWISTFLERNCGNNKDYWVKRISFDRFENIYNDLCNWRKQFNS